MTASVKGFGRRPLRRLGARRGRRSKACYENRMAGCGLMHLVHTADTRADVIFIDNGAPEVLVGCHENSRTSVGVTWPRHWVRG